MMVEDTAHTVFLCLGSNLGNRAANLHTAIAAMAAEIPLVQQSSIYETEPWGYTDQPAFLNQAIRGTTHLEPMDLLAFLKKIERTHGRSETFRFGPRIIDLDILLYDDLVMDSPVLTIPHPRLTERAFVLIPLAEIAPDWVHPVSRKTIQQLKSGVDSSSVVLFESANS